MVMKIKINHFCCDLTKENKKKSKYCARRLNVLVGKIKLIDYFPVIVYFSASNWRA